MSERTEYEDKGRTKCPSCRSKLGGAVTPGDGSAAVRSEPRRWTLYRDRFGGRTGFWIVGATNGPKASETREVVTVEEVGPVSEAQMEALAFAIYRDNYVNGPEATAAAREHWTKQSEGVREACVAKARRYLAVLSAAREVKSEFGRGLLRDVELLVVRSDVQSVIDRMKLDVQRPELRCPARDEDYRATLERAVARLDGEVKSDG